MKNGREVEVRKFIEQKTVNGKTYKYEYHTLSLNLYIPKQWIEKFGTKYYLLVNEESGVITIKPEPKH